MIGLKDNDRIFLEPVTVDEAEHLTDFLIHRGNKSCIHASGLFKVLIEASPAFCTLQWVVRHVDGPVEKKRFVLVCLQKMLCLLDHQIGKECTVFPYFLPIAPQVVSVRTLPVKEMGPIVDAPSHVTEGMVESLTVGHGCRRVSQVPFPYVTRRVAGGFEQLSHGRLMRGHAPMPLLRTHVSRDTCMLWETSCKHRGSRGGTNRGRRVKLSEADALLGQLIQMWCVEVFGSIAVEID